MTKSPLLIGAHTSAAGGSHNALYQGREIGATAIQFFTSNQRQWHSRSLSKEEIALFEKALDETGISHVMSHASYLINLGSSDAEIATKSRKSFREEIQRCHDLKLSYLNFHPGTATTGTVEECLECISSHLLDLEDLASQGPTRLLLETTAGQGKSVGHRFEHLAEIIQKVKHKIPIGVTIDTCHIFAAGYDIRTEEGWTKVLKEFDVTIGLEHLYAFHVNDSLKDLGSRVDRHAPLGQGKIGIDSFRFLMVAPKTRSLPKYLETPDGPPLWKKEIALLREFAEVKVS
jgi:deoxyribonuclease-4